MTTSNINGAMYQHAPVSNYNNPTWAPADKDAVGTSLGNAHLWFTIAQGIITEVYFPRPDIPNIKDMGFIVADDEGFWVELRRLNNYSVEWHNEVIPAITITHHHERFTLTLKVCTDSNRDVLLVDFVLQGDDNLKLYVLASPRLGGDSLNNTAWADSWEGRAVLWAEQGASALAITAVDREGKPALGRCSVGYVGESDGWQDFKNNNRMSWEYTEAGPGEVAVMGQLPQSGVLALGLSCTREAAATLAFQSLNIGFAAQWNEYCQNWQQWVDQHPMPLTTLSRLPVQAQKLLRRSATTIKVHEDHTFPGAFVASLASPWGEDSNSLGGYHLVWSRDLVETAGALIALGYVKDAQQVLSYLMATQQADGHWLQNQWLGGKAFWQGIQLDETAFPVILASMLEQRNALNGLNVRNMVHQALRFIVREGPSTSQDRWEEDPGINTFTLTVAIAALVEGSRFLEPQEAECALMVADSWNTRIEDWSWAGNTRLAQQLGVSGYYMRSAPVAVLTHDGAKQEHLLVKNRAHDLGLPANEQLAIDCLQLARFGLRAIDNPNIVDSIKAIDALLKTETPNGAVWHRYNGDGYGEHSDGSAFNGWGIGRGWPLLTGERGHMALLNQEDVTPYLNAMSAMTGKGGLLPEQVWDTIAIPDKELFPGEPCGSAMPLVWAHAEFVKLCLSLEQGAPVDRPAYTWARYGGQVPQLDYVLWQPRQRIRQMKQGQALRIMLPEVAQVHWGVNGWQDCTDTNAQDWGLGFVAQLETSLLQSGDTIDFTLYWPNSDTWQGENFQVTII